MIKATSHTLKFSNVNKREILSTFIDEYRRIGRIILDDIWDNGYRWETEEKKFEFNVKLNLLDHPKYIDYNNFNVETSLSARALSSLVTQLSGIIGSSVEKQRKRLWKFNSLCEKDNVYNEKLYEKIKVNTPVKPNIDFINPELSSKCLDWEDCKEKEFNGFLRLKSLGDNFGQIRLPIKFHKLNKRYSDWGMKNSFLIGKDFINIRWEKEEIKLKSEGITVGCDQGMKTVISLSDRQVTKENKDGYDLDKIIQIMSRKTKGSLSFKKSQDHRKNYINWSINQLNLNNIKEIRLENIINIGYKNPRSRKLGHWTNTIIRDKLEDRCKLLGVHVIHQSSTYRSQRCSSCSLVRKSSRKGKEFDCSNCGLELDADYNASLNHEIDLPDIPQKLRKLNLNRKGFFWKEAGFYDLNGVELRVPLDPVTQGKIV